MNQGGVFSLGSISRCVRAGDSARFKLDLKRDFESIVENAAAAASTNSVSFSAHNKVIVRGKPCLTYTDYHTHLVVRAMSRYLANRFLISPPNRNQIIGGVIAGLKDSTPFHVIRRDISSFYETVGTETLRQSLLFDTGIPRSVRGYLAAFLSEHCPGPVGLPRGIGLTAVLVELAMQSFDNAVRRIPGVYRYWRYADDILLFTFSEPGAVEIELQRALPLGMQFNRSKSQRASFDQPKKSPSSKASFEFLGYKFEGDCRSGFSDPRELHVTIADGKIKRLKTRIILALKAFKNNPNTGLLIDRIKFLASNYRVHRHGISTFRKSRYARAGIFHNYRFCGHYSKGGFVQTAPSSLPQLDNFLHGLLWGQHSLFSAHIRKKMTAAQMKQLRSVSFEKGFRSRRVIRMSYSRIAQVKEAWRNV